MNPLENPIFIPVLIRLLYILAGGLFIVLVFNIRKMDAFFQSETWKRYLGWLVMAPIFILGVFLGPISSLLVVVLIIYNASKEYSDMLHLPHFFRRLILLNGAISIALAVFLPEMANMLPVIYFIVIMLCSILRNKLDNILNFIAYTLFASMWICYGITHFILIYKNIDSGVKLLLVIGFSIALSDVLAYVIGKLFYRIGFGVKQVIASRVSPNKTYAGVIGNMAGASIGVFTLRFIDTGLSFNQLLVLIAILTVFSIMGDLMESLVKRFGGVKDSSGKIPGHGGFLDRVDSLLVTAMACYYFFIFIKGG